MASFDFESCLTCLAPSSRAVEKIEERNNELLKLKLTTGNIVQVTGTCAIASFTHTLATLVTYFLAFVLQLGSNDMGPLRQLLRRDLADLTALLCCRL